MQYTKNALKRINHMVSELDQIYHAYALKFGFSDSTFAILYTLSVEGGSCLLSEIVKLTGLPKQTVNSAIRKMEDEKTIFLTDQGKRRKIVNFTKEGEIKAKKSAGVLIEVENNIFASWGEEKTQRYISETEEYNTLMLRGLNQCPSN